jgi:hypothetical protein
MAVDIEKKTEQDRFDHRSDAYVTVNLTASQWTDVLDLTHMWGFERIRKVAIEQISKGSMDPFQKVLLAHKYEITEWYEDAYVQLAMRADPISVEEARTVGFEFGFKMEKVRAEGYASGTSRCASAVSRSRFPTKRTWDVTCGGTVKNGAPNEAQLRPIVRRVFALDRSTVRSSSVFSQQKMAKSPSPGFESFEKVLVAFAPAAAPTPLMSPVLSTSPAPPAIDFLVEDDTWG